MADQAQQPHAQIASAAKILMDRFGVDEFRAYHLLKTIARRSNIGVDALVGYILTNGVGR